MWWKMRPAHDIGSSVPVIIREIIQTNGFYMDSLASYSELQVTSNFSFLRGASHPEELMQQAAAYGRARINEQPAIALTDRNTLAGIVRAHAAAKKASIRFIPGCRLDLLDGPSLLALPTDKDAYSRLSALLTVGNLRAEKGECHLYRADVYAHAKGMIFILVPPDRLNPVFDYEPTFYSAAREYREAFGSTCYLAACRYYGGDDAKQLYRLSVLAADAQLPLVATNDIHYHHPGRRELQDVLTCIREKCTIREAGFRLHPNAERYMKPEAAMKCGGSSAGILTPSPERRRLRRPAGSRWTL
jgi:error-prone DNA polymerase